jgi:hypothetical protein
MKVLFFSPFTGIAVHSIPEASVAKSLERAGASIDVLTCGSCFAGQCITLSAYGLTGSNDQARIKRTCTTCTAIGKNLFGSSKTILDMFNQGDLNDQNALIEDQLKGITKDNVYDYVFDGIEFGRLAAYQHMLRFKKNSTSIEDSEWPVFQREVKNCLITYLALKNYSKSYNDPEIVLIYNTLYSVNATARRYFERRGATVYTMHAGPNMHYFYDTLSICKHDAFHWNTSNMNLWPKFRDVPLSQSAISYVEDHFDALFKGKSIFAYAGASDHSRTSAREYFNIKPGKKIVLAAMSSYDENFAGLHCGAFKFIHDEIFPSQIEWVKALIDFAKTRSDLVIIVRIHPRELPNKRENRQSEHSKALFKALTELPENVLVNVPDDQLTIHQVAAVSDLILTAWSSAAIELGLLGMPVLTYTAGWQGFPADLVAIGRTIPEYFEYFDQLIESGWNLERSLKAFRWVALEQYRNCITLNTNLQAKRDLKGLQKLIHRVGHRFFPGILEKNEIATIAQEDAFVKMILNKEENPAIHINLDSGATSESDEKQFVQATLRRIGALAFGPSESWPTGFRKICAPRQKS